MNDPKDAEQTAPEQNNASDAPQHEPASGAQEDQTVAAEPSLEERLAAAEAQAAENWDACVRARAEQENIRRRAEREVQNAHRYALEKPMTDLLAAVDSLELGLKSAEDEAAGKEAVLEGMRLTLKQLTQALERNGLGIVDPQGEVFNPERHEAISMVESAEVAPQHVLSVLQKGYLLNERLLRPAMVIVAKAPSSE